MTKVGVSETANMTTSQGDSSTSSGVLDAVLSCLPLHTEEGTLRESLAEDDLRTALSAAGIGPEAAALLITMLRRQFEALALLDRAELAQGRWAFVSFPASLLGRSIVEILFVPGQAIFPPDYWEHGDHRPEAVKDEQRALLHRVENERLRQNQSARPVRVVHVAWAVIRIGDRFLLHHREDRDRPGEKTHVLPGGRFNPGDLSATELAAGPGVLRQIFDVASPLVDAALDKTLIRELFEELGLHHTEDYRFERWQRLEPYRKVAGAGNRHAYTEYGFHLYTLKLTAAGEVRLLDREAESRTLTWFTAAELAAPQRADGASAFVDVLHAAWGNGVAEQLASAPDSAATEFAMTGESNMLDLPGSPEIGFQIGKPGKEKPLPLQLNDLEWQLLLLLGWHARGFSITPGPDLRLLGGGWVRVTADVARTIGTGLLSKVESLSLPLVEIRDGHYLRLRIDPDILMLGAKLFGYRVDGSNKDGGVLTVERSSVTTPWCELAGAVSRLSIGGNTVSILRELERGDSPEDLPDVKAKSWERNLRDQLSGLTALGLRRLWSTKHNVSSLVEGLRHIGG
jgi:8-oxo-dGTP pyrophosphatase MutT (NUDIX family)